MIKDSDVFVLEIIMNDFTAACDSLETAQAIAAMEVSDYFGKPLVWKSYESGTFWDAGFHSNAYQTEYIFISKVKVRTREEFEEE